MIPPPPPVPTGQHRLPLLTPHAPPSFDPMSLTHPHLLNGPGEKLAGTGHFWANNNTCASSSL